MADIIQAAKWMNEGKVVMVGLNSFFTFRKEEGSTRVIHRDESGAEIYLDDLLSNEWTIVEDQSKW